jgi:hypothetical protein
VQLQKMRANIFLTKLFWPGFANGWADPAGEFAPQWFISTSEFG